MQSEGKSKLAAVCGLYCGICSNYVDGTCHGCGCQADDCFAGKKHEVCAIYKCAFNKGLNDCSSCEDFPCTELIQFTFDPILRTHLPVLENLRRRKKLGTEKWIKEQEKYWKRNKDRFEEWIKFHRECKAKKLKEKIA